MYKETFSQRIKKAREEAGYTQTQVAKLTGISQEILSRIETGAREPSIENLGILTDFYEVNLNWLLGTGMKKK